MTVGTLARETQKGTQTEVERPSRRAVAVDNFLSIATAIKAKADEAIDGARLVGSANADAFLSASNQAAEYLSFEENLRNSPDGSVSREVSKVVNEQTGETIVETQKDYLSIGPLIGYIQSQILQANESLDSADKERIPELESKLKLLVENSKSRKALGLEINEERKTATAKAYFDRSQQTATPLTQEQAEQKAQTDLESERLFFVAPEIIPSNQPLDPDQLERVASAKEYLATVSQGTPVDSRKVLQSIISLESNFARLNIANPEYVEMKKGILENFETLFAEKSEDPEKNERNRLFVNDAKIAIAKWERGKFTDGLKDLELKLEEYKGYPDKVTEINKQIDGYKARVIQADVVIASDIRKENQDLTDKPNNFAYLAAQAIQALDPKTFGEFQKFESLLKGINENPLGTLEDSMQSVLADGAKRTRLFGFARGEAVNEFIASLPDGNSLKANPDKLTELVRVMAGDESRSERAKRFGMIGVMAILAIMFFGLQSGMSSMNQESH